MHSLLLLGSTGSIGRQTLELLRDHPGRWRVEALAAHSSWQLLVAQAREFAPRRVALVDLEAAERARAELGPSIDVLCGAAALEELARVADYDVALHGVVGASGVRASCAVLERGKRLALANKESLVVAGAHLMALARERGGEIVPVDSEHSAVFQCLRGERLDRVRKVWLTASGGPFRARPLDELATATPSEALRHPNWTMGKRITIGSATLMNKALEVIELHHLFGLERERIGVVIHPQSLVHSMVEFVDGSVMAQMGPPDMRGPIHYALHHPDRAAAGLAGFDVRSFATLTFEEPDHARFPALELGYRCVETGSDSGCVLNAADEVSVQAFLDEEIGFQDMARVNAAALARRPGFDADVEALLRADGAGRALARNEITALTHSRVASPGTR